MARSGRHPFGAVWCGGLQRPVRRDSPGGDGVPPADHQFPDPARLCPAAAARTAGHRLVAGAGRRVRSGAARRRLLGAVRRLDGGHGAPLGRRRGAGRGQHHRHAGDRTVRGGGSRRAAARASSAGVGALVGLLSSVVPYSLEMVALRTLPPRVFGILMSLEPAVAALAAAVLLSEWLTPLQLLAMACVTAASVGAARTESAPEALPRD